MKRTNNRLNMSHDEQVRFPFIRVKGLDFSRRIYSKYGYSVKPRRSLSLVFHRLTDSRNRTLISNFYITRVINTNFDQYLNTFKNVIEQLDKTQISNRSTKNLFYQDFFPLQIPKGRKEERDARKDYIQPYSITPSYKASWPIMAGTKYPTTILKRLHHRDVLSGKTGDFPINPLMNLFNQENNASFLQAKFESKKIADFSTSIHSTTSSSHQADSIRDRIIHQRIPEPGLEPSGPVSGSMKPHLSSSFIKQDSPARKKGEKTPISSTKLMPEDLSQQIHEESALQYPIDPSIKLESGSSKEIINKDKLRSSKFVKEDEHSLEPFVFKKPAMLATDEKSEPMSMLDLTTKNEGGEWVPVIQVKNNLHVLEHSTFLDNVIRKYPQNYNEVVFSKNFTKQNAISQIRDRKIDMYIRGGLQPADAIFQHIDNRQKHSTFLDNIIQKYPQNYNEEVFSNNFTRQGARSQNLDRKNDMLFGSDLQLSDAKFQHINNRQETTQFNQQELKKHITTGISDLIMRKSISHDIEKSTTDISENINRTINRKNISTIVTENNISKKDETNIIADKVYKIIENKLLIEKERRGIT